MLLSAFDEFFNIVLPLNAARPFYTVYQIAGYCYHSSHDQLFNCVCVSAGCVEYDDSVFCAIRYRNVVCTCACACDREKAVAEFHRVAVCTADEYRILVSFFDFVAYRVFFLRQAGIDYIADSVKFFDFVHLVLLLVF